MLVVEMQLAYCQSQSFNL